MSSNVIMETVEIQEPEQKENWSECILAGLNEMRQNNTLCDVILNSADNKLFCVHSAVLGAGSRFFRQVLSQSKSSGGGIVVRLEKSSTLVSKMVDFLYTGRTAASVEELEELRQMADGYGLERLSSLCTERLYGITVTVVPTPTEAEDADAGLHTLVESIAYTEGVTASESADSVVLDSDGTDLSQQHQVPLPIGDSILANRCRRHPSAIRTVTRPGVCGKKTWRDYRYKCAICAKEFTSLSRLRGHEATHTGEKRHECTICGARFIQIEYLREHVSMHSNVRPFSCDVCHASFRLGRHLKKHQKVHSSDRPYACSICGKTFKRADRLRQHDRVHSGERPYPCPHCDKSFKVMEALVRHKRALHYEDCPFRCGFCGTGFKRMKGLEDHLRSCDTALQRRSLQCDVCGSFFKTKITLLRHKRKHLFPEEEAEKENDEGAQMDHAVVIVKQEKHDESNHGSATATLAASAADLTSLEPVHLIQSGDQIEGEELGESAIQMLMQTATEVHPDDSVDGQEMGDDGCIQVLHVEFVSDHGVADANGHVVEEVTAEQMAAELHATTHEGVEEVSPEVQFVQEAIAAADHTQYVMSEAMPTEDGQTFMQEVMTEPGDEQTTLQEL